MISQVFAGNATAVTSGILAHAWISVTAHLITGMLTKLKSDSLGELTRANPFNLDATQKGAWIEQITILKRVLTNRTGRIYFEYAIPRTGKRIDVVLSAL